MAADPGHLLLGRLRDRALRLPVSGPVHLTGARAGHHGPAAAARAGRRRRVLEDSEILSVAQAKAEVPNVILKRTKKVARGLKRKCARRGEGSVLIVYCTISWNDNKKYNYNGSMRLARNDDGTLSVRFDGRRAQRTCLKKGGGKRCYKKWKFSYEEL